MPRVPAANPWKKFSCGIFSAPRGAGLLDRPPGNPRTLPCAVSVAAPYRATDCVRVAPSASTYAEPFATRTVDGKFAVLTSRPIGLIRRPVAITCVIAARSLKRPRNTPVVGTAGLAAVHPPEGDHGQGTTPPSLNEALTLSKQR